jgi:hypothetical protein
VPSTSEISMCAASYPSWYIDWSIVVSGGPATADSGMLSNPTTERSPGTLSPSALATSKTCRAMASLAAKIAVGRSGDRSNVCAGTIAASEWKSPLPMSAGSTAMPASTSARRYPSSRDHAAASVARPPMNPWGCPASTDRFDGLVRLPSGRDSLRLPLRIR